MPLLELSLIATMAALGWLWVDSLKAREAALRAARNACALEGLLFLDDTVSIASIRLSRLERGWIELIRCYGFEFSDDGNNRLRGSVVVYASGVTLLNIGVRNAAGKTTTPTLH